MLLEVNNLSDVMISCGRASGNRGNANLLSVVSHRSIFDISGSVCTLQRAKMVVILGNYFILVNANDCSGDLARFWRKCAKPCRARTSSPHASLRIMRGQGSSE